MDKQNSECLFKFADECLIKSDGYVLASDIIKVAILIGSIALFSFAVAMLSFWFFYKHNPLNFFALSSDKDKQDRNRFIFTCAKIFFVLSNLFLVFSWLHFQSPQQLVFAYMNKDVLYFAVFLILLCLSFCFLASCFLSVFSKYFNMMCFFSPLPFAFLWYRGTDNFLVVVALIISMFLVMITVFDILINGNNVYNNFGRVASIMWRNIIPIFTFVLVVSFFNAIMAYFSIFVLGYFKNEIIGLLVHVFIVAWLYYACSGVIKAFISSFVYSTLEKKSNRFSTAVRSVISAFGSICYITCISAVVDTLATAIDLVSLYICGKGNKKNKGSIVISIVQYFGLMLLEGVKSFLITLQTVVVCNTEFLIPHITIFGGEFDKEAVKKSRRVKELRSRQSIMLFAFLRILLSILSSIALFGMLPFDTGFIFSSFTANLSALFRSGNQDGSTSSLVVYTPENPLAQDVNLHAALVYFSIIYFCFFVASNFISSYFSGLIAVSYFDYEHSINSAELYNTEIDEELKLINEGEDKEPKHKMD